MDFKNIFEKIKKFFKDRTFKYGTNAVVLTILILGVIWFVGVILDSHPLKIDTTASKQFSLAPQTIKILKSLKVKVNVSVFVRKGSLDGRYISDLVNEFSKRTSNLVSEVNDVDRDISKCKIKNISQNDTVVFECGTKRKDVMENQIFFRESSPYGQGEIEYIGEQSFINAILSVTEEKQKVICFTEGHKELDLVDSERGGLSELNKYLIGENYSVRKINIIKEGKIADDCDVLVVSGPKIPLINKEAELIKGYLKNGGKAIFLLDPLVLTNLEPVLEDWNIKLDNDVIIDTAQCFSMPLVGSDPVTLIPTYKSHLILEPLLKANIPTFFPVTRSISDAKKKLERRTVTKEDLLVTSDKAWGETNLKDQKAKFDEGKDLKGPLTFGVVVSEFVKEVEKVKEVNKVKKEEKEKTKISKETKFVVIGDSDFITNAPAGLMGVKGNIDLFINSINWMVKEGEKISLRAKRTDIRKLNLTPTKAKIMFYISFIITPLLVIGAGVVVWLRRRAK
ncbi:MAG: Gldg family protein [Candidatus Firestonebacteria bacterium]